MRSKYKRTSNPSIQSDSDRNLLIKTHTYTDTNKKHLRAPAAVPSHYSFTLFSPFFFLRPIRLILFDSCVFAHPVKPLFTVCFVLSAKKTHLLQYFGLK